MNRFVTLLALAIGVSGPASAGAISPYVGPLGVNNTNVVAGQVSASGVIEHGSGFRVRMITPGVYDITFDRRYFPSGCAAMVVSPISIPVFAAVRHGSHCRSEFQVDIFTVNGEFEGDAFMFIAREDAPQNP
jgi:hypothetical protein